MKTTGPTAPSDPRSAEDKRGWQFDMSNEGANHLVVLLVGFQSSQSLIDLGVFGTAAIQVSQVMVAVPAGYADGAGDLALFIQRPTVLDPQLEGMRLVLQTVSLDVQQDPKSADVLVSNVVSVAAVSASRYN